MKQASISKLYRLKVERPELTERINSVLLAEGGAGAVLYPYNNMEEQVVALSGEGMSDYQIAQKLGIDIHFVRNAVEDPTNYMDEKEYRASCRC
ncbi:MAG: hypothetical protein R6U93_00885 [Dehalococcoidia bacterium]